MRQEQVAEAGDSPTTVVFLLVEGFSMMSFASAVEPLRSLNRLVNREAYRWRLASLDGGPVQASNGISLSCERAEDTFADAASIFVCGGLRIALAADERRYLGILRKAARARIAIGALSTGTYLLARAGLLDGYRCTIHWENRPSFQEEFPAIECSDRLYEIDRDRLTCSGGTASMDLMLHLVTQAHGLDHARRVANQFHHERIRDQRDNQRGGRLEHLANLPTAIRGAVRLMQGHIENPISVAGIAQRIGLSPRQLERLFLRYMHITPARYYLVMRIERARELLLYSDQPILDVAVATGFASTSHFSQWFKRIVGARPSELRGRSGTAKLPGPLPAHAGAIERA